MRGRRHYISASIVSLIFMIGLMAAINPAKSPTTYVKIYVDQPLGYIPFETPGDNQAVVIPIKIETSGFSDGYPTGIVGWGLNVRVDPNVLDINTVPPPPPPFPPPPAAAKIEGGVAGYFLYEYGQWYGIVPTFMAGSSDPTTGYWKDIAETFMPNPGHGAGDYVSVTLGFNKLTTIYVTSKSNQPCVIDLVSGYYKDGNGNVYPADILVDGYYGAPPPRTMSYQGSLLPPGDPTGTMWHELYPQYCKMWDLVGWTDNGDGDLTASDQIDMVNATGWIYHFHVDVVTITIHWTFKPDGVNPTGVEAGAEPNQPLESPITDPIGTTWHQIYPVYCEEFVITSWEDNGDGVFSTSDQFDFEYFGEGVTHWAHLEDITTDIILSQKGEPEEPGPEFPLGLEIMMMLAAAIPIVYIWRTRKWRGKK